MTSEFYVESSKVGLSIGAYYDACREETENDTEVTNRYNPDVLRVLAEAQIVEHRPERPKALAYTMPWFKPELCAKLIALCTPEAFTPNEDEPEDAQIPEVVLLEKHPELGQALCTDFFEMIEPIVQAKFGYELDSVVSAQLALYEANGRVPSGCLHTDRDSDLTVTVALNDDYEGGGLHILTGGADSETVYIPKQPAGTATIFEGRTKVHMGQPVTKGSRYLLVFWCQI